ncbi:MAG: PorV/PorQ family protein [Candidatus Firestonebacteria bacterium]
MYNAKLGFWICLGFSILNLVFICSILCLLPAGTSFAGISSVGTAGADFLLLDVGARPTAMGGAFAAIADDSNAIAYNPAGMALFKKEELQATHIDYMALIPYEHISYAQPISGAVIGFSIFSLHTDIWKTDADGNDIMYGRVISSQNAYAFSLAFKLRTDLYFGTNLKGIYVSTYTYSAGSGALDLGLLYKIGNASLGLVGQHLGLPLKMYSQSDALPANIKLGCGIKIPEADMFVALDLNKAYDIDIPRLNFGTEFWAISWMALRGGLRLGYDLGDWTMGMGFKVKILGNLTFIDYAYVPMIIDNTHRFSMIIKF